MPADKHNFYVSFPPYVLGKKSVSGLVYHTLLALVPAVIAAFYYFGVNALRVMTVVVITSVLCEAAMRKFLKRNITISDGHAVLTGLLLSFLLPPTIPWWIAVVGAASAIIIGKQIFGGLGNNPFNASLIGWVMIRLSWPNELSQWAAPLGSEFSVPPLHAFKFEGIEYFLVDYDFQLFDLFMGRQAGGIGAICIVALLAGGIYLLLKRVYSWHIPAGLLGAVLIFSGILWFMDSDTNLNPLFQLAAGSTVLGAFFLATDPVTSPVTRWGKLAYGILIGALVMIIRTWGRYPDGVAFAILLANTSVPLLNRIRPKSYGKESSFA